MDEKKHGSNNAIISGKEYQSEDESSLLLAMAGLFA
jgi:hypothetical protein